jgi:hypothetical protein
MQSSNSNSSNTSSNVDKIKRVVKKLGGGCGDATSSLSTGHEDNIVDRLQNEKSILLG